MTPGHIHQGDAVSVLRTWSDECCHMAERRIAREAGRPYEVDDATAAREMPMFEGGET